MRKGTFTRASVIRGASAAIAAALFAGTTTVSATSLQMRSSNASSPTHASASAVYTNMTDIYLTEGQIKTMQLQAPLNRSAKNFKQFTRSYCGGGMFTSAGFIQGATEDFQALNTQDSLTVCAASYDSLQATKAACSFALTHLPGALTKQPLKGLGNSAKRLLGAVQYRNANLVLFRKGNALILVSATGPEAFAASTPSIARMIAQKLVAGTSSVPTPPSGAGQ
jgi:hypothetical protein